MSFVKINKILGILITCSIFLNACNGKIPGADARKFPADPKQRVKKNLEEGRGFTLNKAFGSDKRGGTFDFASSNELWRASLDVIDFMPLTSVNYSGGIIITDWYSEGGNNDSIKLTVRFLSNEIRSDSLKIIVHKKICKSNSNCVTNISQSKLIKDELRSTILRKAALLQKSDKKKK